MKELAAILAVRWDIEIFFEYTKALLSKDHHQIMTAQAVVRFCP